MNTCNNKNNNNNLKYMWQKPIPTECEAAGVTTRGHYYESYFI